MKSLWLLGSLACLVYGSASAQMAVSLAASVSSPEPLGTSVTWTATVSAANPGTLWYRFQVTPVERVEKPQPIRSGLLPDSHSRLSATVQSAGNPRIIADYGPRPSFSWTTIDQEGLYKIEALVKNNDTGETAGTSQIFHFMPLLTGQTPVITPTSHPLVFLYSAPPCAGGGQMRVEFESADGAVTSTPFKSCDSTHTMNFYLAGLRADSQYTARDVIVLDGSIAGRAPLVVAGSPLVFATSDLGMEAPPVVPLTTSTPSTEPVLLQSVLQGPPIATDLSGNIIWYGPPGISFLTRPQDGGTFIGIFEDGTQDPSQQFFREFDLVGNTLAETNAARVSEQLAAMGVHPINSFHHEARKLSNGNYLVLANSERILTDVQGPGPVDVIGDTIVVLNPDLQVIWAWDSFDHLDPHRAAVLGEKCVYPAGLICAPFYLSKTVNDWLHGNALQLTPDGNILFSLRHQDWIIKIDYQNGAGTGNVLWRLGKDGDFQILSSDPSPWFSHQHDANVELDNVTLPVFDDGNTRAATDPTTHSRGQVLLLDESKRTATLLLNGDLGEYSYALGSAQHLRNGHYHFDSGITPDPAGTGGLVAQSLELDKTGQLVYGIQFGALEYRSFRMRDLYTAP